MTDSIILADSTGTLGIDLTKTATIIRNGSNPIIVISIPADATAVKTDGGAESIDLKMLHDMVNINFTLYDGIGSHRYCDASGDESSRHSNYLSYIGQSPTPTSYERLFQLFKYDTNKKLLYWGDSANPSFMCVIDSLSIPTQKGGKLLMENCSLGLTIVNKQDVSGYINWS